MNTILKNTLIVLAVLVLAAAIFFGGWIFGRHAPFGWGWMMGGFDGDNYTNQPGGMMGGTGYGGMMGGAGYGNYGGMMGGTGYGYGGMMGANSYVNPDAQPLTIEQMRTYAQDYIRTSGYTNLEVGEIMIFDNNGYAIVMEKDTGLGAFELLVDSGSQVAYPEYGPNMMWNLKYGMMAGGMMDGRGSYGGMMGGSAYGGTGSTDVSADMPVSPEQAVEYAQAYLDQHLSGAVASSHATQFYGYYTLDYEINGKVAGMMSVNGFSGSIFPHTWHGTFIEESEME